MQNVDVKIDEARKELIIRVDLTKDFGKSSTGKTNIVASTHGFVRAGDVSVSLNVVRK